MLHAAKPSTQPDTRDQSASHRETPEFITSCNVAESRHVYLVSSLTCLPLTSFGRATEMCAIFSGFGMGLSIGVSSCSALQPRLYPVTVRW